MSLKSIHTTHTHKLTHTNSHTHKNKHTRKKVSQLYREVMALGDADTLEHIQSKASELHALFPNLASPIDVGEQKKEEHYKRLKTIQVSTRVSFEFPPKS